MNFETLTLDANVLNYSLLQASYFLLSQLSFCLSLCSKCTSFTIEANLFNREEKGTEKQDHTEHKYVAQINTSPLSWKYYFLFLFSPAFLNFFTNTLITVVEFFEIVHRKLRFYVRFWTQVQRGVTRKLYLLFQSI